MNSQSALPRFFAVLLSLSLALPNPAFALRPQRAGNEELAAALGRPAAGAEEGVRLEDWEWRKADAYLHTGPDGLVRQQRRLDNRGVWFPLENFRRLSEQGVSIFLGKGGPQLKLSAVLGYNPEVSFTPAKGTKGSGFKEYVETIPLVIGPPASGAYASGKVDLSKISGIPKQFQQATRLEVISGLGKTDHLLIARVDDSIFLYPLSSADVFIEETDLLLTGIFIKKDDSLLSGQKPWWEGQHDWAAGSVSIKLQQGKNSRDLGEGGGISIPLDSLGSLATSELPIFIADQTASIRLDDKGQSWVHARGLKERLRPNVPMIVGRQEQIIRNSFPQQAYDSLVLSFSRVSGAHALIFWDLARRTLFIRDLNTRNGTGLLSGFLFRTPEVQSPDAPAATTTTPIANQAPIRPLVPGQSYPISKNSSIRFPFAMPDDLNLQSKSVKIMVGNDPVILSPSKEKTGRLSIDSREIKGRLPQEPKPIRIGKGVWLSYEAGWVIGVQVGEDAPEEASLILEHSEDLGTHAGKELSQTVTQKLDSVASPLIYGQELNVVLINEAETPNPSFRLRLPLGPDKDIQIWNDQISRAMERIDVRGSGQWSVRFNHGQMVEKEVAVAFYFKPSAAGAEEPTQEEIRQVVRTLKEGKPQEKAAAAEKVNQWAAAPFTDIPTLELDQSLSWSEAARRLRDYISRMTLKLDELERVSRITDRFLQAAAAQHWNPFQDLSASPVMKRRIDLETALIERMNAALDKATAFGERFMLGSIKGLLRSPSELPYEQEKAPEVRQLVLDVMELSKRRNRILDKQSNELMHLMIQATAEDSAAGAEEQTEKPEGWGTIPPHVLWSLEPGDLTRQTANPTDLYSVVNTDSEVVEVRRAPTAVNSVMVPVMQLVPFVTVQKLGGDERVTLSINNSQGWEYRADRSPLTPEASAETTKPAEVTKPILDATSLHPGKDVLIDKETGARVFVTGVSWRTRSVLIRSADFQEASDIAVPFAVVEEHYVRVVSAAGAEENWVEDVRAMLEPYRWTINHGGIKGEGLSLDQVDRALKTRDPRAIYQAIRSVQDALRVEISEESKQRLRAAGMPANPGPIDVLSNSLLSALRHLPDSIETLSINGAMARALIQLQAAQQIRRGGLPTGELFPNLQGLEKMLGPGKNLQVAMREILAARAQVEAIPVSEGDRLYGAPGYFERDKASFLSRLTAAYATLAATAGAEEAIAPDVLERFSMALYKSYKQPKQGGIRLVRSWGELYELSVSALSELDRALIQKRLPLVKLGEVVGIDTTQEITYDTGERTWDTFNRLTSQWRSRSPWSVLEQLAGFVAWGERVLDEAQVMKISRQAFGGDTTYALLGSEFVEMTAKLLGMAILKPFSYRLALRPQNPKESGAGAEEAEWVKTARMMMDKYDSTVLEFYRGDPGKIPSSETVRNLITQGDPSAVRAALVKMNEAIAFLDPNDPAAMILPLIFNMQMFDLSVLTDQRLRALEQKMERLKSGKPFSAGAEEEKAQSDVRSLPDRAVAEASKAAVPTVTPVYVGLTYGDMPLQYSDGQPLTRQVRGRETAGSEETDDDKYGRWATVGEPNSFPLMPARRLIADDPKRQGELAAALGPGTESLDNMLLGPDLGVLVNLLTPENVTTEMKVRALLDLVAERFMPTLALLAETGKIGPITDFPLLNTIVQDSGFQGAVQIVRTQGADEAFIGVPAERAVQGLRVFAKPEIRGKVQYQLATLEKAKMIRFVNESQDADLVIGDETMTARPDQVFIQVSAETVSQVTPHLLQQLQLDGLLKPGSVVLLYKRLKDSVLIFA